MQNDDRGYDLDSDPGPVNSYVFVQHADAGDIDRLGSLVKDGLMPGDTGVRFMFQLSGSGPDEAMLVAQAPGLEELQAFIAAEVRGRSSIQTTTYIAIAVIINWIKLQHARRCEAIVRGRVTTKAMSSLPEELGAIPAYMGGAFVVGDYDTVMEFGAETWQELMDSLDLLYASASFESTITGVTGSRAEEPQP